MSDDDIIMLWTLDGMKWWDNISTDTVEKNDTGLFYRKNPPFAIVYKDIRNPPFGAFVIAYRDIRILLVRLCTYYPVEDYEVLYIVEDILSFNPDDRWWKLLLAKHWYAKNKHRFSDGN